MLPLRAADTASSDWNDVVNRHPETLRLAGQRRELTPDLSCIVRCGITSASATNGTSGMCACQIFFAIFCTPALHLPLLHLAGGSFADTLTLARRAIPIATFAR